MFITKIELTTMFTEILKASRKYKASIFAFTFKLKLKLCFYFQIKVTNRKQVNHVVLFNLLDTVIECYESCRSSYPRTTVNYDWRSPVSSF